MPTVTIKDISVQLSELIKLVVDTQHDLGSKFRKLESATTSNTNSIKVLEKKSLIQEETLKKEMQEGHDKSFKRLADRVETAHSSVLSVFKESLEHHFKSTTRQIKNLLEEIERLKNVR